MKLDLTKYDGHTPEPWKSEPCVSGGILLVRGRYGQSSIQIYPAVDGHLMAGAPMLLARVVELEAANAAMLADILVCTAILDADKSHSLTMCDDCWRLLEKYIPEDES